MLFDGFDLLDAIAPFEVFCAAAKYTDDAIVVELVTAEGSRSVASGVGGLKIEATGRLAPEKAGIIVVPGASGDVVGDGPDSVPTILARAMGTELTGLVERALERADVVVATVCGGSLLLAMGGLLEGRPAVTHHLGMDVLGATGAAPVQARVVDDGNLVTGGGVSSGLDVALHLVERELGPRIAHAVERLFEYERRGTVWRAAGLAPVSGQPTGAGKAGDAASFTASPHSGSENLPAGPLRASDFAGSWETTIATPVGKMQVGLSIDVRDGKIHGSATQGNETVEFIDPAWQDDRLLTWSLRVTKPMRLNLKFEVTVDGDVMTGIAKAGILPASKLTGRRLTPRGISEDPGLKRE